MYFTVVVLLLFVFPVASIATEAIWLHPASNLVFLTGKWFVFWAAGVRLFIAGLRQVFQPRFTAEEIFELHDPRAFPIVRELGFANLSMGLLALCSLFRVSWLVPAGLVGGLYYGLAGAGHIFEKEKNAKEYTAMISDLFVCLLLLVFLLRSW